MKKYLFLALLTMSASSQSSVIINEVNIGGSDYFELFNYGTSDISLTGYTALIRDSGASSFNLDLSGISLFANSGVTVAAESPMSGELNAGQNISWHHTRNLSLSILDNLNNTVDFWAHGSALFGAEAGVTFSANPLSLITLDTNSLTYQRTDVTSSGLDYFASDWSTALASRGAENLNQVIAVPAPASLAILGLALAGFGFSRKKKNA